MHTERKSQSGEKPIYDPAHRCRKSTIVQLDIDGGIMIAITHQATHQTDIDSITQSRCLSSATPAVENIAAEEQAKAAA
jgi:hypothetical protein